MHRLIKFALFLMILTSALLLCSCEYKKKSDENDYRFDVLCSGRGMEITDPCPVSFITLAANPDLFDGKYVRVAGFYVKGLDNLLFSDKESADAGIVANAVLISTGVTDSEQSIGANEYYILIKGKFAHATPDKGELNPSRARGLLGEITDIKMVRGTAIGIPYKCWEHSREANEMVDPAKSANLECH